MATPQASGTSDAASSRPGRREVGLIVTLFVAMLFSTFPEFALGVLAPVLLDELELGEAAIGVAASSMYLSAAVLARLAGRRLDDIGGRAAMAVLYGAAIGATALLAVSRSFAWLLAVGIVGGVALAINNPISSRFIVAEVTPGRRGLAIGLKQTGVKVGQMTAGAVLPWLAVGIGWRPGLLVMCALAALALLASLPAVPTGIDAPRRTATSASVAQARGQVRWLQFYAVTMAVGQASLTAYLALYAVQDLALPYAQAGLVVSAFALTATGSRLVWVTVAERLRHPSSALVLLGGAGSVAALLLILAGTAGPALLWAGAVLGGASFGSWNVVVQLAVLAEVETERTGSATGAVQAAFMGGMALGAPTFGGLTQLTGSFRLAWSAALLLAVVATTVAAHRWRDTRRRARTEHRSAP